MSKTLISIVALVVLSFSASSAFAINKTCNTNVWEKSAAGHTACETMKRPWDWSIKDLAVIGSFTDFRNDFSTSPKAVPELSATAAPISIALVGGLLAFGLERRRKQNKK